MLDVPRDERRGVEENQFSVSDRQVRRIKQECLAAVGVMVNFPCWKDVLTGMGGSRGLLSCSHDCNIATTDSPVCWATCSTSTRRPFEKPSTRPTPTTASRCCFRRGNRYDGGSPAKFR